MARFGPRLTLMAALFAVFTLAAPAMSQDVFHGNDNNNDDQRQQSGLAGPGDDNGLFLRRPRGLYYCPRDHGYYRDSRTCGRLERQDLQPPPAVADDAALVSTCGTILHQNGNFRNSISCKSGRVTGFCEKFGASDPECPAIIAQLRREVPNLGGLSYDGSRPISPCRHNPNSPGCKGINFHRDPDLAKEGQGTGQSSRTPNPSASTLILTLESCLGREVSYYLPSKHNPSNGPTVASYSNKVLTYSPKLLAARSVTDRAFLLETAIAHDALEQHDLQYGPRPTSLGPNISIDHVVGFLDHCARDAGLVPVHPNDPERDSRVLYARFVGVGLYDARVDGFSWGYNDPAAPLPLYVNNLYVGPR